MSKIFYLMGKSSSGKDTVYRELMKRYSFKKIIMYTTRPLRSGEVNGREYHFTTIPDFMALKKAGKVLEYRCYKTVQGPWYYFTVNDGQFDGDENDRFLLIGTLESYIQTRNYLLGKHKLIPVYLEIDPGLRLERALFREKQMEKPDYRELCRRFLADEEDFSEEMIQSAEIEVRFNNTDLESCVAEIGRYMESL